MNNSSASVYLVNSVHPCLFWGEIRLSVVGVDAPVDSFISALYRGDEIIY